GPPEQDEQQRQQDKQSQQVRQHGRERGFVGRLNRGFDVVAAQVLLGRAHGGFFFDRPRLMTGRVRQYDALTSDAGAQDLAAVDAVEHIADRNAGLVPDGVGAGMSEKPQTTGHEKDQGQERGHEHPSTTQPRQGAETANEPFHWFLNRSPSYATG